ncbi:ketosteroid isomerase-like protein [Kribbella antiqua]|uniref:Ketosteroid isomerase-like protein n=1 Tax=Kribbella antiqua TaxID=2512217 RepID=A0A4R2IZK8_9ACTN|nr:nuclear transport factor 2 family protein [Kribbella antiqua]TCO51391.1 ketosteroid isomerase-like protein [Kribbella antiqua]
MASRQSEISEVLDRRSEAIRVKDLELLLSFYAPDVIYFDIVPPLQYVGSAALRGRFQEWFDGPIGQDIHHLTVETSGDLAITSMLIRAGGALKNGPTVDRWVRSTSTFRRSSDSWQITHEHVSLPVNLETGTVPPDLTP